MVVAAGKWQWDEGSFILAGEAGVFGEARVELVRGEVWPVIIGSWHGSVAANVARLLPGGEWRVTTATLPSAGSVPDPDVWVHRRAAEPIARLGSTGRLVRWSPSDVALVVEVADRSFAADTELKPAVYAGAGYPCYWVVHRGGVEVFTEPYEAGYRAQLHVGPKGLLTVPYSQSSLDVAAILDADA